MCGQQLTLPALHTHLEQSHAMRLNESTGELEDLVPPAPPPPAAAAFAASLEAWQAQQHFLLAAAAGQAHQRFLDGGEDADHQSAAFEAANGWDHSDEHRLASAANVSDNDLVEDSTGAVEHNGQDANVEYSDDPDAMCQQVCEICGAEALVLRNHTRSVHGLSIAQYRELYPAFKFSSQIHHR
jgi:hypothetical protein